MIHRLRATTRTLSTATAVAGAAAAVDMLDRGDALWTVPVAALLAIGVLAMLRLRDTAIEVLPDEVVVRNVFGEHRVAREDVAVLVPGSWRSELLLTDGTTIPSLLRDQDLPQDLGLPTTVIDLTAVEQDRTELPA